MNRPTWGKNSIRSKAVNKMFSRLIAGAGLFALGYIIGREFGRMEPIIQELQRTRDARPSHARTYDHEVTVEMNESQTKV